MKPNRPVPIYPCVCKKHMSKRLDILVQVENIVPAKHIPIGSASMNVPIATRHASLPATDGKITLSSFSTLSDRKMATEFGPFQWLLFALYFR